MSKLTELMEKEGQKVELIPPMFPHQVFSRDYYINAFMKDDPGERGVMNLSKCGTGKTRGVIEFVKTLREHGAKNKVLVLAPLTILEPSWAEDILKFAPELTYSVCYAKNRNESLSKDVDIYLLNHDAVAHLVKFRNLLKNFGAFPIMVIDEITAYKTSDSKRSMYAAFLSQYFYMVIGMSGTLGSQSLADYYYPQFIVDGGKHLGKLEQQFLANHMKVEAVTKKDGSVVKGAKKLTEMDGARERVFEATKDMTIRFDKDMAPVNHKRHVYVDLPPKALRAYRDMVNMDFMVSEDGGVVTAPNAAVKLSKILQLCSGQVYDENGQIVSFHKERIELAVDLALEAEQAIIAFNFTHERDALLKTFYARGVPIEEVDYIDGSVSITKRPQIVADFQAGKTRYAILHPRSCAHGLTFTAGRRTIWVSPTTSSEMFIQLNHRIDRAGQKNETETITICARGTKEAAFYQSLFNKVDNLYELMALFSEDTNLKLIQKK